MREIQSLISVSPNRGQGFITCFFFSKVSEFTPGLFLWHSDEEGYELFKFLCNANVRN